MSLSRRTFLSLPAAAALARAQSRRPNIVFILADDLGYGDLSCYGQTRIATPNIDRLAAEGTRFTQAYAGSTVCAPSRSCLMTGRHTGHTRIRGNSGVSGRVPLRESDTTVAELLQDAGYRTALFGKWGLGEAGTSGIPNKKGFDEFFGYLNQGHAHDYYPEHLWHNQTEVFLRGNRGARRDQYSHDEVMARALDWVDDAASAPEPFFLYLALTIPHADNELGADTGDGMPVPDYGRYAEKPWPTTEKGFAAMITRMDSDIGRLMKLLAEKGVDEDTLVVFSSDNGPHREGGHEPSYFESQGGLRGIKRDFYEGGIRVPAIVRWPGRVPAGETSEQVWAFWDFLPTACDAAGVEPPEEIDGVSMLPAFLGRPQRDHEHLYWEIAMRSGFMQAVRTGDWKGVRLRLDGPVELYDLSRDPAERNDVAAEHPEVVRRIEALFESSRVDSAELPMAPRT